MTSIVGSDHGTEGAKLFIMSNNWGVIYVASRREKKVKELLLILGEFPLSALTTR